MATHFQSSTLPAARINSDILNCGAKQSLAIAPETGGGAGDVICASTANDGTGSTTNIDQLYRSAIVRLNSLQSNAAVLRKATNHLGNAEKDRRLSMMLNNLRLLNITLGDIDQLNCIHITGTKGKGSTCAFVESILRSLGFKTGVFNSPHLITVRERIRINGEPISRQLFVKHFFDVFNPVHKQFLERRNRDNGQQQMPGYFNFLTLLAFKVFIGERVDVAVVEVGIGGEYDSTNILRQPKVCAITTLDYDHTQVLGNTLAEIAWQKAGIAKPQSVLITVPQSCPEAMRVIRERCHEKRCKMFVVPSDFTSAYKWPPEFAAPLSFGIAGRHQLSNVSLALQICRFWLSSYNAQRQVMISRVNENGKPTAEFPPFLLPTLTTELELSPPSTADDLSIPSMEATPPPPATVLDGFSVTSGVLTALSGCKWPGRCQIVQLAGRRDSFSAPKGSNDSRGSGKITFFIDGAHSPLSIKLAVEWFIEESTKLFDDAQRSSKAGPNGHFQPHDHNHRERAAPAVPTRVLLFHCTNNRDPVQLLGPVISVVRNRTNAADTGAGLTTTATVGKSNNPLYSSANCWPSQSSSFFDFAVFCPPRRQQQKLRLPSPTKASTEGGHQNRNDVDLQQRQHERSTTGNADNDDLDDEDIECTDMRVTLEQDLARCQRDADEWNRMAAPSSLCASTTVVFESVDAAIAFVNNRLSLGDFGDSLRSVINDVQSSAIPNDSPDNDAHNGSRTATSNIDVHNSHRQIAPASEGNKDGDCKLATMQTEGNLHRSGDVHVLVAGSLHLVGSVLAVLRQVHNTQEIGSR